MRLRLATLFMILLVAQPVSAGPVPQRLPLARIAADFADDSQGYALLQELTSSIGHRMTATENGRRAEDFVYRKLRQFGFHDVRFEPFTIEAWRRGSLSLSIDGVAARSQALAYSPLEADVTGELIDLGNGTAADYAKDSGKVRGKIALIYAGILPGSPPSTVKLHRTEKTELAIQHGATAVIFINQFEGDAVFTGTASSSTRLLPIPAITVGRNDGFRLRSALQARPAVGHIVMAHNEAASAKARNIIATLRGAERPDEVIVLGGHLDSWDLATGSVDNGMGAMWMLDVARDFIRHGYRPRRSIEFVFFMGEEQGLVGSQAHIANAIAGGSFRRIRYMINTDMSTNPTGFNLWSGDLDRGFVGELSTRIGALFPAFTGAIDTRAYYGAYGSDSEPYVKNGVPVAYLTRDMSTDMLRCYHADCDTFDLVKPQDMRRSAAIGAMLLYALADADSLPAHVLEGAAIDTYLQSQGLLR